MLVYAYIGNVARYHRDIIEILKVKYSPVSYIPYTLA